MKTRGTFPLFLGIRNFRNYRGGKRRTMAGAVVAVALSVIPLVVVLHVADGMIEGITRRFIELETGHLQLYSYDQENPEEYKNVCKQLTDVPGVLSADMVYTGTGIVYSDGYKSGIQIKALAADKYERDSGFRKYLEIRDGSFDLSGKNDMMLSYELADLLNVKTGSSVKLLTAKKTSNGKLLLRPEEYVVTGIFSTGYYEVDSMTAYIQFEQGEKLFKNEGRLSIQCKIEDPYNGADRTAAIIADKFSNFNVTTWYRMQRSMYESLYTTRALLVFIMAVIVIVAAVNITSSMIIMVVERRQDIAIMKSCGAENRQIRNAFIFTGIMTGIAGAAAGIAAGVLISVNINTIIEFFRKMSEGSGSFSLISASSYYLEKIPVKIKFHEILAVGISTVLLSAIAALFPAVKAEKLSPCEIMQRH